VPTVATAEKNTVDAPPAVTRTVLYVENHPVNVLLMQAVFAERPELRLIVANTGEAGLCAAIESRPQLLLLDLQLPDCHGADLLQRMREVDHLRKVTAVAITADGASDLTKRGFRDIWHKPMDMRTMLMRLDCLLAEPEIERDKAARPKMKEATAWTPAARTRTRRPAPDPIPFPNPAQHSSDAQHDFHEVTVAVTSCFTGEHS